MTLTKDKRSGIYRAKFKAANGKTKTVTTKQTHKTAAKKVVQQSKLAEIEQAARAGLITSDVLSRILTDQKVTLASAIPQFAQWMTSIVRSPTYIHGTVQLLYAFAAEDNLGWEPLADKSPMLVTERHISGFLNAPDRRKASWRRVQRIVFSRFFEFCNAKGWVIGNPAKLVKIRMDTLSHAQKEKRPRNPFTEAEIAALLDLTAHAAQTVTSAAMPLGDHFWHAAVALGRYTGLRIGDIARLEWDCFSVPNHITVWTDKRDRRVQLPLEPRALVDAIARIPQTNAKYVFPDERLIAIDHTRRATLSTYFRRLCDRAAIAGKTFHDLRSSYILAQKRAGKPMPHIAQSVGHASTATTEAYLPKNKYAEE